MNDKLDDGGGQFAAHIDHLIDHPRLIPLVALWNYQQWGYLYEKSSPEGFLDGLRTVLGKSQIPTTFVALVDKEPVGSVSLVVHENESRQDLSPWLSNVFVLPEYRNQGIGSRLVQQVVVQCRALGIPGLYLETLVVQEPFYKRLGWAVREQAIYRGQAVAILSKDTGMMA